MPPPFPYHFHEAYEVSIPGTRHPFKTSHLFIQVYGLGEQAPLLQPAATLVSSTTYDVTIQFARSMQVRAPVSQDWRARYWRKVRRVLRWLHFVRPRPPVFVTEALPPQSGVVLLTAA